MIKQSLYIQTTDITYEKFYHLEWQMVSNLSTEMFATYLFKYDSTYKIVCDINSNDVDVFGNMNGNDYELIFLRRMMQTAMV